ncbi:histidine phosphatase family protein [Lutibacter sp.]|uniref:SixA phosphatase family protein n=1 Tax=Lutibacter sp. TaxID=1925666 RepID=UPI0027333444|nr:phosphoglycerate mutase family protein [Lutibacter sp.]MDP3313224.1 phosphoglycerate mutase family protein [Lutibacter sp.]
MKKIILLCILVLGTLQIQAQVQDIKSTTYYLIRHAEKERTDPTDKNPHLTDKGKLRAEKWSTIFKNVDFDLVYTTNYNRTIETASPTALSKNLELQFYNTNSLYDQDFIVKTEGKNVLIVGHSNTTPLFVNTILGSEKYPEIDDLNNSNLYIITITKSSKTDILLTIDY